MKWLYQLPRVLKTTALRLLAVYLLLFIVSLGALTYWLVYTTRMLLEDQIRAAITNEIQDLTSLATTGGIRAVAVSIFERMRKPSAPLYFLANHDGRPLISNIYNLPPGSLDKNGIYHFSYRQADGGSSSMATAGVYSLPGGFRIMVGRDRQEIVQLTQIVWRTLGISLGVVAIITLIGIVISTRLVLTRVNAIAKTSRQIIDGDLSKRMPITNSGDEFDRLSLILNVMLDRIERLMRGFKEVSDNIAHDLKTPLARIRSRAEATLMAGVTDQERIIALENTIKDADILISTFNALLMITRADAGNTETNELCDLNSIVRDVSELYQAVGEEENVQFKIAINDKFPLKCNRELLSLAIANLIDNALKYGTDNPEATITIATEYHGHDIVITIADNGNGVPQNMYERMVERFFRLDNSRTKPGSGLGLSMVNAIARLHNGKLCFSDNQPGLAAKLILPRDRVQKSVTKA